MSCGCFRSLSPGTAAAEGDWPSNMIIAAMLSCGLACAAMKCVVVL
jgi:hypothetical protein